MQVLTFPSGLRPSSVSDESAARLTAAKLVGAAGVLAYNWWVVVPFVPGLMPSVNGFFSDLEASGRPHAPLMSDADLIAGVLMAAALLLRGSNASGAVRKEWKWLMLFAIGGAVGGRYPYACSEGLSATCRTLEWHLQLPIHHYVHVVAGITEFATLTTAALIAMRRTRGQGTIEARIYSGLVKALAIGYPFLGLAYLTNRMGTLVEPVFFAAFSVMILAEVFEPIGRKADAPMWNDRVTAGDANSNAASGCVPTPSGQA